MGYSPWGHTESDSTECSCTHTLHTHMKIHKIHNLPLNHVGVGAPTLHIVENPHRIYSWSFVSVGPLYPRLLICGFNCQWSCSIVFTTEKKNLHVSGPVQFKLMLFKGQLYIDKHTLASILYLYIIHRDSK